MLEEGGGYSAEGTLISGEGAGRCGLEERAAGELFISIVEISSGAMRAVAGVAENHLGYSNSEGLWALWMVQYGRIQGNYHLKKGTKRSDTLAVCRPLV